MELAKVKVTANRLTVEKRHIIVAGTIGATVAFEYDDPWNSMDTKTLVWRSGTVTKDDITASGIVPAEVLEKPGRELLVGVYGTKGDTATPTLWASLGYIHDGADPSGDEATDPVLPVWAQLEHRVSDLEGEGLSAAVADYLEKNPVEAGATAEEAAQIKKNSEDIEKLNADKLDASKLPEAVNDALAQAKASGEFDGADGEKGEKGDKGDPGEPGADGAPGADGYTPAKGVDYFTDADKQEIAQQAAELVEVPEVPEVSMQPLTFTGAVEATYDGSKAVSVEIPQGGGGSGGVVKTIVDYVVTEPVSEITIPFTAEMLTDMQMPCTVVIEMNMPTNPNAEARGTGTIGVYHSGGYWSFRLLNNSANFVPGPTGQSGHLYAVIFANTRNTAFLMRDFSTGDYYSTKTELSIIDFFIDYSKLAQRWELRTDTVFVPGTTFKVGVIK